MHAKWAWSLLAFNAVVLALVCAMGFDSRRTFPPPQLPPADFDATVEKMEPAQWKKRLLRIMEINRDCSGATRDLLTTTLQFWGVTVAINLFFLAGGLIAAKRQSGPIH